MKKLFLLAGFALTLVGTSCKKDNTVDNNPPDNGDGNNTKLLKKFTDNEAGVNTVYNLIYDANKRLTSIKSTDNKESILFTYDDAGNLTNIEETEPDFHNYYDYTYNNGKPVSGTFKSYEKQAGGVESLIELDELTYTVANEQVTNIHLNMTLAGQETDFKMTYQDGNLTQVETPGTNVYKATFTYGNKKPIFPIVTKWMLDQAGFALQFASKHEVLSMAFDFPGTELDQTIATQYTYDSKGYVLTSNNGTNQITFEYQ